MLTVLLGAAAFIAFLLACDWALGLWDRHVARSDQRLGRVYGRAAVRWVPPVRRSRRARRSARRRPLPPITSPEPEETYL